MIAGGFFTRYIVYLYIYINNNIFFCSRLQNLPLPNGDSLEEKFGDTEEDYDNYYYPDNFNASMGDGYNYIDHSVSENNFDGTVSVAPEHVEYYDYNPSSFIDDADGYEDGNGSGGSGDDGFPTRTTDSQDWWR